jgi:arylformamidase
LIPILSTFFAAGAAFLVEEGVFCVGIDSLGIERNQQDHATHKLLFENNVWVLEGLRLRMVLEGSYLLVAAPLMLPEREHRLCGRFLWNFPRN